MKNAKILVTAAAGKTGFHVVEQLLEQDFHIRAMVRKCNEKTAQLESLGAEIVIGDYFDIKFLRTAMTGIKRAYFCYPPADRLLEATTNFAVIAKEAGLESVVNMSQIISSEDHPSPLTRQHWLAEQILDWADVGAAHIRPTLFAEMPLMLNAHTIASDGKIYLPYGEGRHAPVTSEDIARVVVGILTKPEPHIGKAYTLTGEQTLSQSEIAETIGRVLGKPVEYFHIPSEVWEQGAKDMGFPAFLIKHLSCVAADYKNGEFNKVTDVVLEIGGQPPQTFENFIRKNISVFENQMVV